MIAAKALSKIAARAFAQASGSQIHPLKNNHKVNTFITNSTKNYSTTPALFPPNILDPTQFNKLPVDALRYLLQGEGLQEDKLRALLDAGFDGTSVVVIANNIKEEGKKQAKAELLAHRDYQHISQSTKDFIVEWVDKLLVTYNYPYLNPYFNPLMPYRYNKAPNTELLLQLRELFNCGDKPISNIPSKSLVQTFGKNFEMRNVEQEVQIFSLSIETLIKTLTETNEVDKQIFQSFFIASAPGTGKSRLNQELRGLSIKYLCDKSTLTEEQKQYLNNSVHITTSFKNGTAFSPQIEKSPFDILTYRLLYSYFSRNDLNVHTFKDFISQKKFPVTISDAVDIIRKDREQTQLLKEGEPLIMYFSIDEFQDMLNSEQFLDKQVKELCSAMYSCWQDQKVILIPIYSGLSWSAMQKVLRESTTGYKELPRGPIDMVGIETIAQSVFKQHGIPENQVFENRMVYSYLKKTYGHPRSLETTLAFLVKNLTNQSNWSLTQGDRNKLESQLEVYNPVSMNLAKEILAHTITGKTIRYDHYFGGITAKELDDKGVFKLEPIDELNNRIVLSWYQLKGFATNLSYEEPLWDQFLKSVDECLHNPNINLFSTPFEKFQILFDMILNRCFIYLGITEMTLEERFRGFRYSTEEANFFQESKINLHSFPNTYSQNKNLQPKRMSHSQGQYQFFDCYGTATINDVSYLLGYQQKGTKDLNSRDFDKTVVKASQTHVELIPSFVDEKYKSNYIVLLCLNHRLTNKTMIPKKFMLCTTTVRNRKIEGTHLENADTSDFRTDMEVYFGSYIYNLVFSYLPKRIHFKELDPHMVSRLFGVSRKNLAKDFFDNNFNNLKELLAYLNGHTKQKDEIRLLHDVEIVFTQDQVN